MLNEIHRDGVPCLLRDWELLESPIGAMPRSLGSPACGIGADIVFDEGSDTRPGILSSD